MLLGSGLFAYTSDSITSEGNNITSGDVTTAQDLKAGVTAGFTCDETIAVSDGPIVAATSLTLDLDHPGWVRGAQYCLKNTGRAPGHVSVTVTNFLDTEVGECTETESQIGRDASCADGAQGELSPVVHTFITRWNGSVQCVGFSGYQRIPDYASPPGAVLDPGSTCMLSFLYQVDPSATLEQKAAAQTDLMQWDVVFELHDA